jgi:pimeloyl-ACP methyl ester carboxylesterase
MKRSDTVRAVACVALFAAGLLVALPTPYRERNVIFQARGCYLDTAVIESKTSEIHGATLLLHGLASNKKIMSYIARGYAAQNLRVIVPDLPGHGRTRGPFSPQRAEDCSAALLQDLLARGMAQPDTLILAGHSMGATIALRLADRFPVAGVVAISPAPMRAAHGANPETILFSGTPSSVQNTLIISGQFELEAMRANAADLAATPFAVNTVFDVLPGATHVSLIFDPRVVRRSQQWSAQLLSLRSGARLPSPLPLFAALAGFAGILLIAGPFLRELTTANPSPAPRSGIASLVWWKAALTVTAASAFAVLLLRWWNPLRMLRIFEADYFTAFLLLAGALILAFHRPKSFSALDPSVMSLLRAAFAALLLLLLINGWFELTLSEAWLSVGRWSRFPFLLLFVFPFHLAEEVLLGDIQNLSGWRRLAAALSLRFIAWLAILIGIFHLHSGEVLLALLTPYFVLLCVLQRRGMDIIRACAGSAAAAALFGAILFAGFCLVIFPIT